MIDNKKCYCGNYQLVLNKGLNLEPSPEIHPQNYKDVAGRLGNSVFSNNCNFVSCFPPEEVYVCGQKKIKCLTQHPEFNKWKNEMDSGEMWSMWGEDWVDNMN